MFLFPFPEVLSLSSLALVALHQQKASGYSLISECPLAFLWQQSWLSFEDSTLPSALLSRYSFLSLILCANMPRDVVGRCLHALQCCFHTYLFPKTPQLCLMSMACTISMPPSTHLPIPELLPLNSWKFDSCLTAPPHLNSIPIFRDFYMHIDEFPQHLGLSVPCCLCSLFSNDLSWSYSDPVTFHNCNPSAWAC